ALLLARASEVDGDAEAASAAARRAAAAFAAQGRTAWQGLAELVELRLAAAVPAELGELRVAGGSATGSPAARALALADRFDELGWVSEAVEAALLAGRLASSPEALERASAEGRAHPLARV